MIIKLSEPPWKINEQSPKVFDVNASIIIAKLGRMGKFEWMSQDY